MVMLFHRRGNRERISVSVVRNAISPLALRSITTWAVNVCDRSKAKIRSGVMARGPLCPHQSVPIFEQDGPLFFYQTASPVCPDVTPSPGCIQRLNGVSSLQSGKGKSGHQDHSETESRQFALRKT